MSLSILRIVGFIIGIFLIVLGLSMAVPMLTLLHFDQPEGLMPFIASSIITLAFGALLVLQRPEQNAQFRPRDMYFLTTATWVGVGLFASLPMVFDPQISLANAFFETLSGITTTGATVLSHLDKASPGLLIWRSMLHWLGGIGFIAMAVAVLPVLRVGGMRLFQTESSDWSEKVTPRSHIAAKYIVGIYIVFTLTAIAAFRWSGMTLFDAINHAMSSVATGGFSTSDQSMGKFPHASHWVAIFYMLLGSLPFVLYVAVVRGNHRALFKDQQVRGFLGLVLVVSAICSLWYWLHSDNSSLDAIRIATFHVVSVLSTTGFALNDYSAWGSFAVMAFFYLTFIGGCSGSTTGGLKVFRFQVAYTMLCAYLQQLVHPRAVIRQHYNGHHLDEEIVRSILSFTFFFTLTIAVLALSLAFLGLDMITALTGAAAAVCNVGPGLGNIIGPVGNYASVPEAAKILLAIGMLLGRLEIITVLILITPAFWKH